MSCNRVAISYLLVVCSLVLSDRAHAVRPQLASSDSHVLVLRSDGSLWAWGGNYFGGLGDGTTVSKARPIKIGEDFIHISATYGNSFAIKRDGSLYAWGWNAMGKLGDGTDQSRLTPVLIGADFVEVTGNWYSTVGIKRDGTVWTWGSNANGMLGAGASGPPYSLRPLQMASGFVTVQTSCSHFLALRADGSVWAWGNNAEGQLGDGTTIDRHLPTRVAEGFVAVSAGEQFSLAIKQDGSLWGWGWQARASLGLGISGTTLDPNAKTAADSFVLRPTLIDKGPFIAVTNGSYHGHAIKADHTLWGWGLTAGGAVGNGDLSLAGFVLRPTQVGEGFFMTTNGGGNNNGFAVRFDGSVWAWGANPQGLLGDGTEIDRGFPTPIGFNLYHPTDISADALAYGPLQRRTVKADVSPSQADGGSEGCVFMVAVDGRSGRSWSLGPRGWIPGRLEASQALRCGRLHAVSAELVKDADVRDLVGVEVYAGYGLGGNASAAWTEMLQQRRYRHVHSVAP